MKENQHRVDSVKEYFEDYESPITDEFSFEKFMEETDLDAEDAETFLMNMENEEVMNEIAKGDYSNFSIADRNLFNDSYGDMFYMFEEKHGMGEFEEE